MKETKFSVKKKILASASMLTVSAIMLSSATYAWFTMNREVTVNGMELQAQAEKGLVVTNEDGLVWNTTATASHAGTGITVRPTSTNNVAAWYHNTSHYIDDADATQAAATYTTLDIDVSDGIGYVDDDGTTGYGTNDSRYYLVNNFYIKSSLPEAIDTTSNKLRITAVTATLPTTAGSASLDPSFRVAIKIGNEVFIYAPVTGATTSYTVAGTTATTALVPTAAIPTDTAVSSIPANTATTANAVKAEVYLYFEGEDAACKSSNITTSLDNISVEVSFGLAQQP